MDIKYRIRKRTTNNQVQYYVDYKRINNNEEGEWMGGFLVSSEEEAKEFIKRHKEYEELRIRLLMTEEIIYDETEEKHD